MKTTKSHAHQWKAGWAGGFTTFPSRPLSRAQQGIKRKFWACMYCMGNDLHVIYTKSPNVQDSGLLLQHHRLSDNVHDMHSRIQMFLALMLAPTSGFAAFRI
jgi:hypothetical protein